METLKLETEFKLETLFVSLNKDTINKLDLILNCKEVDINEKSTIRKYVYLVENTSDTPSISTLKTEFPSLFFDGIKPLQEDEINDYINLFISNRKQAYTSRLLIDLAAKVRSEGITESITSTLNSITKSDVVRRPYVDKGKTILDFYNSKKELTGISTGVKRIDNDTGGLQPGTLNTILGFTGSYKTTWAVNIAYNAMVEGKNTLYLSLEVQTESIWFDLISRHSYSKEFKESLEHKLLKKKKLNEAQYNLLSEKVLPSLNKLPGKTYVVDETDLEAYSFYAFENKFREVEKLAIEETGKGIDLVVIDHAQLLKFSKDMKSVGNETSVINMYVSFFRQNAIDWIKEGRQVCMLMLSQSSRTGWQEASKNQGMYRLTALAEAIELERASSVVMSSYTDTALKQVNSAKVQVLKNRDGEVMTEAMEIYVDPVYCAFGDVDGAGESDLQFSGVDLGSLFAVDNSDLQNLEAPSGVVDLNNIDIGL